MAFPITDPNAATTILALAGAIGTIFSNADEFRTVLNETMGGDPFSGVPTVNYGPTQTNVSWTNGTTAVIAGTNLAELASGNWLSGNGSPVTIAGIQVTSTAGGSSNFSVACNLQLLATSEKITVEGTLSSFNFSTPYFGGSVDFGNTAFSLYELQSGDAGGDFTPGHVNQMELKSFTLWIDNTGSGGATHSALITATGDMSYNLVTDTGSGSLHTLHVEYGGQAMDVGGLSYPFSSMLTDANSTKALVADVLSQAGVGSSGDDNLVGGAGNDVINGHGGNDSIDGGAGIDTAVFSGNRSSYSLLPTDDGNIVYGPDGTDTLRNIERLQFDDKKIALDASPAGHAGQAMELIGVLAPSYLGDLAVRGAIVSLFDQGYTMEQLCQVALNENLVPHNSIDLANTVYHNVIGSDASAAMTAELVGYIETHSQVDFLAAVAGLHLNVDLVGLQLNGVEYI